MKNPQSTEFFYGDNAGFMELVGFAGYYVNRFNDVYSFRSINGQILNSWVAKSGYGSEIKKLTLFDDSGKRKQVSRHKILVLTLGKEEFEIREKDRQNRVNILEKEAKEKMVLNEKERRATMEMLAEMHIDTPLHKVSPEIADIIVKRRILGELY